MIKKQDYESVARQLQGYLADHFQDARVRIADNLHYRGTNVVVTTPAFAGLLPEQRFGLLLRAIPEAFFRRHLHGGIVWFELAPGESATDYMKMPRSEDVAAEEPALLARLAKTGVLKTLGRSLKGPASRLARGDFTATRQCLESAGWTGKDVRNACLVFIRHGALCDADMPRTLAALADDD